MLFANTTNAENGTNYSLQDSTTEATFDVLVNGDTTYYGRRNIITTNRLNIGVTESAVYGGEPDVRTLEILLIDGAQGARLTKIETLFKADTVKRLYFPDVDVDASSSATASGQYVMTSCEKQPTFGGYKVRVTMQANDSEAVT